MVKSKCDKTKIQPLSPCFYLGWTKSMFGVYLIRFSLVFIITLLTIDLILAGNYLVSIFLLFTAFFGGYIISYFSRVKLTQKEIKILDETNITSKTKFSSFLSWVSLIYALEYAIYTILF